MGTDVRKRRGKLLLINDERLMINDCVHTENAEGDGERSASGLGCGQELLGMDQEWS